MAAQAIQKVSLRPDQLATRIKKKAVESKQDLATISGTDPREVENKNVVNAQKIIRGEDPQTKNKVTRDKERAIASALIGLVPTALAGAIGGVEAGAATSRASSQSLKTLMDQFQRQDAEEAQAEENRQLAQQKQIERDNQRKQRLAEINLQAANAKDLEMLKQANKTQLAKLQGTKGKQPKGDQRKAATFAKRMEQAEGVFNQLDQAGVDRTSVAFVARNKFVPEFLESEEFKVQKQAERNFVNAVLRRESGASIADSEFESAERQYFPRPGDTPQVLKQKKLNRIIALQGLRAEAGERALVELEQAPIPQGIISAQATGRQIPASSLSFGTTPVEAGTQVEINPLAAQFAQQNNLDPAVAEKILRRRGAIR